MPEPMTADEFMDKFHSLVLRTHAQEGYEKGVLDLVQSLITAHRADAIRAAYVKAAEAVRVGRTDVELGWVREECLFGVEDLIAKHDAEVKDGS